MDFIERQSRTEALAEDVLTDQQLAADYTRKQQEHRDALRWLQRHAQATPPGSRLATSTVSMGDFFLVVPTATAKAMVSGAQRELEAALGDVRQRLNAKTQLLSQLEADDNAAGGAS
ncbi:hypothetical protein IWQ57_000709 [Coemansia nantahalensis]|uniref:Uncharacterized protein n=1 Tax=Coemansia nantahalensis TaxID=2789366 RepID=A0ACC1K7A2_9FUNG|nr:hypothetical protein IWQ57_000709 [Coemansia nantahalensis]